MNSNKKFLFIDRDGTLVDEPSVNYQIDKIDKIQFKPDVFYSLLSLKDIGYRFIMITNQDGLGTEEFTLESFKLSHDFILRVFRSQGIDFDDILICPHKVIDNCTCRKPKIGLVTPWLNMVGFDKKNSYVIGDRDTDLELASNMGIIGLKYGKNNLDWSQIAFKIIHNSRYSKIHRVTKETDIIVEVCLNLEKKYNISTGINFFDHMLEQIPIHSGCSVDILSKGDLHVDDHHIIEDTGIALGSALYEALGDRIGIQRFGCTLPMDESISSCILDLSNRPYFSFVGEFCYQKVSDFSTIMVEHFFRSLCYAMHSTMHITVQGRNDHHAIESIFKAFARTLRQAIKLDGRTLPSSKGML
ncbi:MAG: bifunctional histidinol-phosphatase/imidazoleglycerol-phosphate dehydratase HisB [Buchnera aphidicola (Eriosoma harunire)]